MRKFLCLLAISGIITAAAGCDSSKIRPTTSCNLPAYNLQNRYLQLTIIPQSDGRIAALNYRPEKFPLFQQYSETREHVNPLLPEIVISNRNGYKLWFWGRISMPDCNLKVVRTVNNAEEMSITMTGRNYMAQPFMLTQAVTLPVDAAVVNIKTTLRNGGHRARYITPWLNSVPSEVGQTIYPVKGGIKRVQGRNVRQTDRDELLAQSSQTSTNFFAAPAQPWVARKFPGRRLIMAYVTEAKNLIPGGLFYTWHGAKAGEEITSLEMVFAPHKVAAEEAVTFHSKIMVFKGLDSLKTICGDIGIDCKMARVGDNLKVGLILNAVAPQAELALQLGLVPVAEITVPLLGRQKLTIDKLMPGRNHCSQFMIPVKVLSGHYYLAGRINGERFLILEVVKIK